MRLYYQIEPSNGEIVKLCTEQRDEFNYDYAQIKNGDWQFLTSWRKIWPNVNPLLSELKLFRRWRKVDRAFRTIGDRPVQNPDQPVSSFFSSYKTDR